jgi:NAD(P)-dependent dehydrogenase (short-subunit alcohol dehydrogenase family)
MYKQQEVIYMDEQKIAIITGGASGIGKALAIQLANNI